MTQENKNIQPQAEPYIVKSHDIHIDNDYADWIADIKNRYRSAQVKAAVKVNAEKLLFNWQLGRDLVQKKAEERWGTGVVEQVSLDLKREFPDADGFSVRNLWYMKQWYLFYTQGGEAILELQRIENQHATKMRPVGAELNSEELHHWWRKCLEKLKQTISELMRLKFQRVVGEKLNRIMAKECII